MYKKRTKPPNPDPGRSGWYLVPDDEEKQTTFLGVQYQSHWMSGDNEEILYWDNNEKTWNND